MNKAMWIVGNDPHQKGNAQFGGDEFDGNVDLAAVHAMAGTHLAPLARRAGNAHRIGTRDHYGGRTRHPSRNSLAHALARSAIWAAAGRLA